MHNIRHRFEKCCSSNKIKFKSIVRGSAIGQSKVELFTLSVLLGNNSS